MQARAFEARNAQYLLPKASLASGEARPLMPLGLDRLFHEGLTKVIVAVPKRSIYGQLGRSLWQLPCRYLGWVRISDLIIPRKRV